MASTMFERYGGFTYVSRIVSAFYDKALESPVLSPYFVNTDMRRLIDHQTKFISQLMGGPASYSSDTLERAHRNLGIDGRAFAEMLTLLTETLEDFEIASDDVTLLRQEVRALERHIVTRR